MASSISANPAFTCSSVISQRPHNDIISCERNAGCNIIRVSFLRKSKFPTAESRLKIGSKKNCNSEEPDDDDDDGGGKKWDKVSTWKKWVVGISLSIILPSYRRKLGPLGILRNRVNEVIETTETVTEVVEDLAEGVKSLAEELERRLPAKDNDGKVKEALDLVEKLAEETIKTTDLAQELIDKVEEAEELLEGALAIAEAKKQKEKDSTRDKH